jgi:hypothetical protein
MRLRLVWLITALAPPIGGVTVAGCGGASENHGGAGGSPPAGSSGSTTGGANAAVTPNDVCREAVAAYCKRRDECNRGHTSCAAFAQLCPDYYFASGSTRTVASVRDCIPVLASMSCTDIEIGLPIPCLSPGSRADGAPCAFDSQCQSLQCSGGTSCGPCVATSKEGERCGSAQPRGAPTACDAGDYCGSDSKCAPLTNIVHAKEGQACARFKAPYVSCTGDLYCLQDQSNGNETCVRPLTEGQQCTRTPVPCAYPLECVYDFKADPNGGKGTCESIRSCGSVTCDEGSYCDRLNGSVCAPLPGMGMTCRPLHGAPCAAGLTCTVPGDSWGDGKCLPPGAGYQEPCDRYCNFWQTCRQGYCSYVSAVSCDNP